MAKLKMYRKCHVRAHKRNQHEESNPGIAQKARKEKKATRKSAEEKMAEHVMGVPSQE